MQIESYLPEKRQNLMFSATIPSRVEKVAIQLMKEPLYTVLGKVCVPDPVCSVCGVSI